MTRLPFPSFLCALLLASGAKASPECDPSDKRLCAQAVQQGQPAPFSGQLLTVELAIRLGQKADRCDATIEMERDLVKKLADIELEAVRQMAKIDHDAYQASLDALHRQLEAASPPFWEKPLFVALVTGVVVSGVFALASYTAHR